MAQLNLDYQRGARLLSWEGALLLAVAVTALAATGVYFRNLSDQAALWESRAEHIERAGRQRSPAGLEGERMASDLALEVKRANQVLRQLSVPWNGLFQTVEDNSSKDVTLLGLEPDTEKGLVKISGEAKNIAAMLEYIKQLENRDVFGTVYLQSHHIQLQDPEKPVRFVLLAIWRDPS
ncbi:hypothetical protein SKTS_24980 [Sulfurimicrobium lacus]|uniref:Fimbrial protein n=1 Tax=Sulfurimicrobium lacus TaxID=2715678 RepID=A0A6F8VF85_9PROT|nr:hypothetical protein [Sulfurimicrobium lacus]BCB27612.1 hypothetical protein SKTS_24980 [Sulfurimicrobium lacus]